MADNQDADRLFVAEAKQDGVREPVHEPPANPTFDNRMLRRVSAYPLDRRMYLSPEFVSQSGALLVVVRDRVIEIRYGEGVILNPHFDMPPVRRKNSA